MTGIHAVNVPQRLDGPSLVAAASGLMLIPENASRLVRLHRLAALGMGLSDNGCPAASPSAIRSILKQDGIGGPDVLMQEDPYSEVLIRSISFFGGTYLVSPGSGEHTVADMEHLMDALFREQWIPGTTRRRLNQLIQGLLAISDLVLKRAGLHRGTIPRGSARSTVDVPGAARLKSLTDATYISNDELDARGQWLRALIDAIAIDAEQLNDPCIEDVTDERLYITPLLRLANGYRVVLPLDLLITIRFHILRVIREEGLLAEFGKRWRDAVFRRIMRLLPHGTHPTLLDERETMTRHLVKIDEHRDLHLIMATDPLIGWQPEVWGMYDTRKELTDLAVLVEPKTRAMYSPANELIHLVVTDSPGRGAFWGVPNIDGADPVLIAKSEDLEVIWHHEPDGLLGLLLFAEAVERRPGESLSTNTLDEYAAYYRHEKSFYFSDGAPPTMTLFAPGDGYHLREKYIEETDRHGVVPPVETPFIVQAIRRYTQDAPEIFIIEPGGPYPGCLVELGESTVFVRPDIIDKRIVDIQLDLMDCVAFWIRECAQLPECVLDAAVIELRLAVQGPEAWLSVAHSTGTGPAVTLNSGDGTRTLKFTETFVALLQEEANSAERELVEILLTDLFKVGTAERGPALQKVAPVGPKRMLTTFDQSRSPDMMAKRLPSPLTGHGQVAAQLLDELGAWLRSDDGGRYPVGALSPDQRVPALNAAVRHLFDLLQTELGEYEQKSILDFLIAQNESLVHSAKFSAIMLRSRLACFGEQSNTVSELVRYRNDVSAAHRANRFLIEYVAAQPPSGDKDIQIRDYYRLLSIAWEIIDRATASDFLHYQLANFDVSILPSGRLGLSREEPVTVAMTTYAANSGMRSVREAQSDEARIADDNFDYVEFVTRSDEAMRAEFGFTLTELREVCGALLDLATADQVTRVARTVAVSEVAASRGMALDKVDAIIGAITLSERASFFDIGSDALPWRFNRDMSYVRRPLVLQGRDLVFGFRSIYQLGKYLVDNMLSGRLQGRAKTLEMQRLISEARGEINDEFARSVSAKLERLGMTTRIGVKKIGSRRIVDPAGNDLGDIDVLAVLPEKKTVLAIEAKDFEVARTPAEIAGEVEKLFIGKKRKKATVQLHSKRLDWLQAHLAEVVEELVPGTGSDGWSLVGAIVSSDPLITPLVSTSPFPVIPFDDLDIDTLGLVPRRKSGSSSRKRRGRRA